MAETERVDQPKQASQDDAPRMDCPTCHVSHVGPTAEALRARLGSDPRAGETASPVRIEVMPPVWWPSAEREKRVSELVERIEGVSPPGTDVRARLAPPEPGPGAVPSPDGLTVEQTQILREVGKDVDAVFGNNDGTVWDCPECGTNVTGPAVAMPCPKCGVQMVRRGSPDGGDLPAPRRGSPEWLTGEVGELQRHYYGTPPGDWATAWDLFKRAMRLLLGAPPAPREGTVPGAGAIPPRRGVEEAMSIERFRRAVNKALYDHGEWVLSARYYRLPEEACEHLANASIASEKAVVAIYEAALSAGPPPDDPDALRAAILAVVERAERDGECDWCGAEVCRGSPHEIDPPCEIGMLKWAALRAPPPLPTTEK